jgi:hypothetical protein
MKKKKKLKQEKIKMDENCNLNFSKENQKNEKQVNKEEIPGLEKKRK